MQLIFATGNTNKLTEVKTLVENTVEIVGLGDIGFTHDLPETHMTLDENALEKAAFIHEKYKLSCFAEDTGLEIEALGGEPGVLSARYAGENKNSGANIDLVLKKMAGLDNRKARFRTIIALIIENDRRKFEGIVNGWITNERYGSSGFGYDPIFKPEDHEKTFAEMTVDEKNTISHRGKAVRQLVEFLKNMKAGDM